MTKPLETAGESGRYKRDINNTIPCRHCDETEFLHSVNGRCTLERTTHYEPAGSLPEPRNENSEAMRMSIASGLVHPSSPREEGARTDANSRTIEGDELVGGYAQSDSDFADEMMKEINRQPSLKEAHNIRCILHGAYRDIARLGRELKAQPPAPDTAALPPGVNLELGIKGHCPACLHGQSLERGEGTHLEATFEHPTDNQVGCLDCGRPYPHGLDFVLTFAQWKMINPDEGGVLCPSCMVNRAAKLPGVISVYGCIILGKDLDPTGTLESIIAALRLENADYCRENRELRHTALPEGIEDLLVKNNYLSGGATSSHLTEAACLEINSRIREAHSRNTKWVSVKEAPETIKRRGGYRRSIVMWVWDATDMCGLEAYFHIDKDSTKGQWFDLNDESNYDITHYQPLPAPPVEPKETRKCTVSQPSNT